MSMDQALRQRLLDLGVKVPQPFEKPISQTDLINAALARADAPNPMVSAALVIGSMQLSNALNLKPFFAGAADVEGAQRMFVVVGSLALAGLIFFVLHRLTNAPKLLNLKEIPSLHLPSECRRLPRALHSLAAVLIGLGVAVSIWLKPSGLILEPNTLGLIMIWSGFLAWYVAFEQTRRGWLAFAVKLMREP